MKNYRRNHPQFSLCGLNCALCPIHNMEKGCPGCGGGEGHQSCRIITCSLEHGGPDFCSQCPQYPCDAHYTDDGIDIFIPKHRRCADLEKAETQGLALYLAELDEKEAALHHLLAHFNDGRRKSFFCTAVNLLPLADVQCVMQQIQVQAPLSEELKVRAATAADLFQAMAQRRGLSLKLRKKPR